MQRKRQKKILERYCQGEVSSKYVQLLLGIGRSRFFELVASYKDNPQTFTTTYKRVTINNRIASAIEKNMLVALEQEQKFIEDPSIPLHTYNYSYIRDTLHKKYDQTVAVSTIIKKAKDHGFYLPKRAKKAHDREVLTNYIGELLQHDSSHHLFAPLAQEKWYLITTLDDHSRLLLFARFFRRELSWNHLEAYRAVCLSFGVPLKYYVDSHAIFRFVQGRDSVWREHKKFTDEIDTQWKQVVQECGAKVTYALSPQAKGKVERSYRWLQDRLVRTCMREGITSMIDAQHILDQEVDRYNYKQVHSTTGEVPHYRFQRVLQEQKSLFRTFSIPKPYSSLQDIFCFRTKRIVDAYHKISFDTVKFFVHNVPLHEAVDLRITPDFPSKIANVRIWYKGTLTDRYTISFSDLKEFSFE